jgi:hypothetical protein
MLVGVLRWRFAQAELTNTVVWLAVGPDFFFATFFFGQGNGLQICIVSPL